MECEVEHLGYEKSTNLDRSQFKMANLRSICMVKWMKPWAKSQSMSL